MIASDLVATSNHVFPDEEGLSLASFVFDYNTSISSPKIPQSSVYKGIRFIVSGDDKYGEDWCIIQLDRKVVNRDPILLKSKETIQKNDHLYMIGHPRGMPIFVVPGKVTKTNNPLYLTDLDAFEGNSGSPVFSAKTGEIKGIFSRGRLDFYKGSFFSTDNDYSKQEPSEEFVGIFNLSKTLQNINQTK